MQYIVWSKAEHTRIRRKHRAIIRHVQTYVKQSVVAAGRLAYKILTHFINKSIEKGQPNLNLLFNYNMPFRAIAKMTGGICTMEMAQGILTIVNGHFFKGLGAVIGGFFRAGKKRKAANAIH